MSEYTHQKNVCKLYRRPHKCFKCLFVFVGRPLSSTRPPRCSFSNRVSVCAISVFVSSRCKADEVDLQKCLPSVQSLAFVPVELCGKTECVEQLKAKCS